MNARFTPCSSVCRPPRASAAPPAFVAVAGLSARMLAQSARHAGLRVAALDVFGDRDTRQASELWIDIGGAPLSIDGGRLVDALERVARLPRMLGWIGTSGLEPFMSELARAPRLPPFLGSGAQATAAVRDPRRFFALLDALGIGHPPVSFTRPADLSGWLVKLADGCGGMHIEPGEVQLGAPLPPHGYYQRRAAGRSMSALFVAARREARVIGFAEQLSFAVGDCPFVHEGSIGPVGLPANVAARIAGAIGAIVASTGLAGLNSFDFLLDGETLSVLEINARPSSTMALYEEAGARTWPRGLIASHIDACLRGCLSPAAAPPGVPLLPPPVCAGQRVLFAPRAFVVSGPFSDACLREPGCRDVPMPGALIEHGQPVCTLLVRAASEDAVRRELDRLRARVLQLIETCHESDYAYIQCHS